MNAFVWMCNDSEAETLPARIVLQERLGFRPATGGIGRSGEFQCVVRYPTGPDLDELAHHVRSLECPAVFFCDNLVGGNPDAGASFIQSMRERLRTNGRLELALFYLVTLGQAPADLSIDDQDSRVRYVGALHEEDRWSKTVPQIVEQLCTRQIYERPSAQAALCALTGAIHDLRGLPVRIDKDTLEPLNFVGGLSDEDKILCQEIWEASLAPGDLTRSCTKLQARVDDILQKPYSGLIASRLGEKYGKGRMEAILESLRQSIREYAVKLRSDRQADSWSSQDAKTLRTAVNNAVQGLDDLIRCLLQAREAAAQSGEAGFKT